jgi:hypothetical protein
LLPGNDPDELLPLIFDLGILSSAGFKSVGGSDGKGATDDGDVIDPDADGYDGVTIAPGVTTAAGAAYSTGPSQAVPGEQQPLLRLNMRLETRLKNPQGPHSPVPEVPDWQPLCSTARQPTTARTGQRLRWARSRPGIPRGAPPTCNQRRRNISVFSCFLTPPCASSRRKRSPTRNDPGGLELQQALRIGNLGVPAQRIGEGFQV